LEDRINNSSRSSRSPKIDTSFDRSGDVDANQMKFNFSLQSQIPEKDEIQEESIRKDVDVTMKEKKSSEKISTSQEMCETKRANPMGKSP
jgi:hypothetical protein